MQRLADLITRYELLLSIGIFGVAQMGADILADLELGIAAAILRGLGIALIGGILIWSLKQRHRPLNVPLVFTEAERREVARAELKQFEMHTHTERVVKMLDTISPVREEELYIQLQLRGDSEQREALELRKADDPEVWRETLKRLVREWDEEVDERLKRWITGRYQGVVYHISPDVMLPAAFYLGAAVGLRRNVKIYQRNSPNNYHLAIDLAGNARRVLEPPEKEITGIQQKPAEKTLPETRGDRLILHLSIGGRSPAFEEHPDHAEADSVGFYYPESLPPNEDWLPYVQAFVQRAKPWVDRYAQVDICLITPHSVGMALGMAFSRSPHVRLCHRYERVYKPVAELRWIEQKLPFD